MYSELIYTRCGEGIDISKGRSPIKISGFKVYSCSENITESGFTDLPFLISMAQSKEPYADPSFMDDAYLFFVPDAGGRYFVNFHPIPKDREATGNYSHRSGNFINQMFIGPFDDIYPHELFGNASIWDAQKRGEAYYYENAPTPLAPRRDFDDMGGRIHFEDIAAFVADGRREVLMNAVAFIISQYALPAEQRKFLVIRDVNSETIEMWVAALEYAFSPRMASGLSFATRLDKFVTANKYTVNLNGQYQNQINLQSPNQKLRLRAMIVGVDERDRANTAAARALPNSPFILLDGKTKTLSVSVETADPYYRAVTAFDANHKHLCREFMQMVDVTSPSDDVLKLHAAYVSLSRYHSGKQVQDLLSALHILERYKLIRTKNLERLYQEIKQEVPYILQKDAIAAFTVINWLERTGAVAGDPSGGESFRDVICRFYANQVFMQPQSETAKKFYQELKKSVFSKAASEYLTSRTTADTYANTIRAYSPADWVAFSEYFTDAAKNGGDRYPETAKKLLADSVGSLYKTRDGQRAVQVVSLFAALNQVQTVEVLLAGAKASADQTYSAFIIQVICRTLPDLASSENGLTRFYQQIQKYNLNKVFAVALSYRVQSLESVQEMERFLDWMLADRELKGIDITAAIKTLDKRIVISDRSAGRLAYKIQVSKPEGVSCINSAHVYALTALEDKRQTNGLVPLLNSIVRQGFPSLTDEMYAQRLAYSLFNTKLPDGAFALVVTAAAQSAFYSEKIAAEAVRNIKTKQDYLIGELISIAAKTNSRVLFDALASAFADIKQFDKGMAVIYDTLRSDSDKKYFVQLEKSAKALHDQKKSPSLFGRLFSRGTSDGSGTDKKN